MSPNLRQAHYLVIIRFIKRFYSLEIRFPALFLKDNFSIIRNKLSGGISKFYRDTKLVGIPGDYID